MPQTPEPGWFYSSLAQVTAAIVGFLGGFVILRLLSFMEEWRRTADNIVTTGAAYYAKQDELVMAEGNPETTPTIESDQSRLWGELVRLLRRRDAARFPTVVVVLAIAMLALTGVGIIWPLLALRGPSDLRQWAFLTPWVLIVVVAALLIGGEALRALRSLKGVHLPPQSETAYTNYIEQFEMVGGSDATR